METASREKVFWSYASSSLTVLSISSLKGIPCPRIDGAVGDHEIPQEHPRKNAGRVSSCRRGEHDGSGVTPEQKLSPCRKVDTPALRHTLASPCSAVQFLKVPLSRRNRATLFSVPSSRCRPHGDNGMDVIGYQGAVLAWYWRTNLSSTLS